MEFTVNAMTTKSVDTKGQLDEEYVAASIIIVKAPANENARIIMNRILFEVVSLLMYSPWETNITHEKCQMDARSLSMPKMYRSHI